MQSVNILFRYILSQWGRINRYAVALCWFIGLLLGFYVAIVQGKTFCIPAQSWLVAPVSFVHFASGRLIPVIITYLAYRMSETWLLFPVGIYNGICFGYCCTMIGLSFGAAGWLFRFMLLFSRVMITPALIYSWISGNSKTFLFRFMPVYAILILLVDFFCIIPFIDTI